MDHVNARVAMSVRVVLRGSLKLYVLNYVSALTETFCYIVILMLYQVENCDEWQTGSDYLRTTNDNYGFLLVVNGKSRTLLPHARGFQSFSVNFVAWNNLFQDSVNQRVAEQEMGMAIFGHSIKIFMIWATSKASKRVLSNQIRFCLVGLSAFRLGLK